jgi:hypothetical protein
MNLLLFRKVISYLQLLKKYVEDYISVINTNDNDTNIIQINVLLMELIQYDAAMFEFLQSAIFYNSKSDSPINIWLRSPCNIEYYGHGKKRWLTLQTKGDNISNINIDKYPYRNRLHEDFVLTQEGNRSTKKPLTQHEIVRHSITEANVDTQTPTTPLRKKSRTEDDEIFYNVAMMDTSIHQPVSNNITEGLGTRLFSCNMSREQKCNNQIYQEYMKLLRKTTSRLCTINCIIEQHKQLIMKLHDILFEDSIRNNDAEGEEAKTISKWTTNKLLAVLKICDNVCSYSLDEYNLCERIIQTLEIFLDNYRQDTDMTESDINALKNKVEIFLAQKEMLANMKMKSLAQKAVSNFKSKISITTALEAYNAFKKHSLDSNVFQDKRGSWKRPNFLIDTGLYIAFENYIRYSRSISVDICKTWLEGIVKEKFPDDHPARKMGLSRGTIHKWLRDMGCTYCRKTKVYYTDRHDTSDNIEDRVTRYIPDHYMLSVRQPVWVTVDTASVDEKIIDEAIEDANYRSSEFIESKQTKDQETIQIHIDYLDPELHTLYRNSSMSKLQHPGEFFLQDISLWTKLECRYGHQPEVCKCHCPIFKVGHDEKIFHSHSLPSWGWEYQGKMKMSKKGIGSGMMISGFVDSYRGYGLPMSDEEYHNVNCKRAAENKQPLHESPGNVYFAYGENRQGYWDNDHFTEQTENYLDCLECLYPDHQIVIEADWSSGHMKFAEDALIASNLNVNFGGKQPRVRETYITNDIHLGANAKLKVGDVQKMQFTEDDEPPFYQPKAQNMMSKLVY